MGAPPEAYTRPKKQQRTEPPAGAVGGTDGAGVIARLMSADGAAAGPQLDLPHDITVAQLNVLLNKLLTNEDDLPYAFYVDELELEESLGAHLLKHSVSVESVLKIVYRPQAVFHVRALTRCSSTLPGHTEAVLSVSFSPDGRQLASGSGDTTVRLWNVNSNTPWKTCAGHTNWVLTVQWSPDCALLASGSMDSTVRLWKADGSCVGVLKGHRKHITCLAWEPAHLAWPCRRIVSGSRDTTAKVWDVTTRRMLFSLSTHTGAVTAVRWGGAGTIYTASRDRTIRCWSGTDGAPIAELPPHAHWVNALALSTDYALRCGACDERGRPPQDREDAAACMAAARKRYEGCLKQHGGEERLVTGSDDFTMFLYLPPGRGTLGGGGGATPKDKHGKVAPVARMTGHQQLINHIAFSPDGRTVASASFDRSVRVWDGVTGTYLNALRGHVGPVYMVAWSADGRLIASASKDSTVKVWSPRQKKMKEDLPGHADEVFALDWCVASS